MASLTGKPFLEWMASCLPICALVKGCAPAASREAQGCCRHCCQLSQCGTDSGDGCTLLAWSLPEGGLVRDRPS